MVAREVVTTLLFPRLSHCTQQLWLIIQNELENDSELNNCPMEPMVSIESTIITETSPPRINIVLHGRHVNHHKSKACVLLWFNFNFRHIFVRS